MTARWRVIVEQLRQAIEGGQHPPGSRLPTEQELAERYAVTRTTVRKALAELTAMGLLTARPRLGTFVPARPLRLTIARYGAGLVDPHHPQLNRGPWEAACAAQGVEGTVEMTTVEQAPAPAEAAERLGVPPGTQLVHRARRMLVDGQRVQLQDAWMPAELVEGTELAGAQSVVGGVYAAMTRYGIPPARATEDVAVRMPTGTERAELELSSGTPVLEQWRTTYDAHGRAIEALRVLSARCVYIYDVPITPPSA